MSSPTPSQQASSSVASSRPSPSSWGGSRAPRRREKRGRGGGQGPWECERDKSALGKTPPRASFRHPAISEDENVCAPNLGKVQEHLELAHKLVALDGVLDLGLQLGGEPSPHRGALGGGRGRQEGRCVHLAGRGVSLRFANALLRGGANTEKAHRGIPIVSLPMALPDTHLPLDGRVEGFLHGRDAQQGRLEALRVELSMPRAEGRLPEVVRPAPLGGAVESRQAAAPRRAPARPRRGQGRGGGRVDRALLGAEVLGHLLALLLLGRRLAGEARARRHGHGGLEREVRRERPAGLGGHGDPREAPGGR